MAKRYTFKVTLRSAWRGNGFISSSFKLYGENPNMELHEVTCELADLDAHVKALVANYKGEPHKVDERDLKDPTGQHVVSVDVHMPKGVRKPPGFNNRWDATHYHPRMLDRFADVTSASVEIRRAGPVR